MEEQTKQFDTLFENPPAAYRGAPFWAWNCRLDREQLLRQIDQFKQMGLGGFHIHCRVGLDTEYLGDEFFDDVKACCAHAKQLGLLPRLYDEDRWPSGSAGGLVTKDHRYRSRFLVMKPQGYHSSDDDAYVSAAKAVKSGERTHLASYSLRLDADGYLLDYNQVAVDTCGENIWHAWLEVSGGTPWFNNQAYVNTLDKAAAQRFIETTYEKYYDEVGGGFGGSIPTIFTDEPQTSHKETLRTPFERTALTMPFSDDFEEDFYGRYGLSLLAHLPELLWELPDGHVSKVRYLYHAYVCERFSENFCDVLGQWCTQHNIGLTGHMMNEWTLHSQTSSSGDVMRPLKEFALPGVDMLCDRRELSTVKQAASVAHQFSRQGVMSEIYGVTGWHFDLRNHKLAGDWQAALGVTLRVHHLTWVSMAGEAKRDYPASIGLQSPWYKEYAAVEDHFARLNTALTRGRPLVDVAVIHPVESYWLYWGNQRQTAVVRQDLEEAFTDLNHWLASGLIDFDFISESLLAEDSQSCADAFHMGCMAYHTVVVPGCHTLRKTTLAKLEAFAQNGGKVIFLGGAPRYVEAEPSDAPAALAQRCIQLPHSRGALLAALESERLVDVECIAMEGMDHTRVQQWETGVRADNMVYQMREDGDGRWLFLAHLQRPASDDITHMEQLDVKVRGDWHPVLYDTLNGGNVPVQRRFENGWTHFTQYGAQHSSFLLKLLPTPAVAAPVAALYRLPQNPLPLPQPSAFRLEEPNVLLLDLAEYAFDDGPWQPEEEILRIDNLFRERLGFPRRMEALAQPWLTPGRPAPKSTLRLRFCFESDIELPTAQLAMEEAAGALVWLNGTLVPSTPFGWYVDESIQKIPLPGVLKGTNTLELSIPFSEKTNVEWCYLLGDFGVEVRGRVKKLVPMPRALYYGDLAGQNLPFYGGNVQYDIPLECASGQLNLEIPHYRGAMMQVKLNDGPFQNLIYAPYRLDCGQVDTGSHLLTVRLLGNRANTFGVLHNADDTETWYGPNLWRTQGNKWSYEYRLWKLGILSTPSWWLS